MERPVCLVQRLGLVDYREAMELQAHLAEEIAAGKLPATLLLLEHPHVFTFGRRGRLENLLWDEEELARKGVSIYWTDRGGDVTYHGPGQLVGYPLLPLGKVHLKVDAGSGSARLPQADYVGYVRKLEQTLILTLARLGVDGQLAEGKTGVWVRGDWQLSRGVDQGDEPATVPPHLAKIAAIGVKVDAQGISRHGFALNVNPDMSYWEGIIGCGLVGHAVVSLADLLPHPPSMQVVMDNLVSAFGFVFQYDMVEVKASVDESSRLAFDRR